MLIIKAHTNDKQTDEIHIQKTRKKLEAGMYMYKIRKPEGYEDMPIVHHKDWGHRVLMEQALQILRTCKPRRKR